MTTTTFDMECIDVHPSVPPDLRRLAICVLEGDPSAVAPLLDCAMENRKGGPVITPAYVQALEDRLMDWRREFEVGRATAVHVDTVAGYRQADLPRLRREWVGLERTARQLGRQGLS